MSELLARLSTRVQDWARMPGGGVDKLTPEMLAQALAGLPRGPYLLARAVFAGDESVLSELHRLVLVNVASRFFSPEHVHQPGFLGRVVDAALVDAIAPPKCHGCQGRGHVYERRGAVKPCKICDGGLRLAGGGTKRMCQLLQIGRARWKRLEPGYRRIEAVLWAWRGQAVAHVHARMRQNREKLA